MPRSPRRQRRLGSLRCQPLATSRCWVYKISISRRTRLRRREIRRSLLRIPSGLPVMRLKLAQAEFKDRKQWLKALQEFKRFLILKLIGPCLKNQSKPILLAHTKPKFLARANPNLRCRLRPAARKITFKPIRNWPEIQLLQIIK